MLLPDVRAQEDGVAQNRRAELLRFVRPAITRQLLTHCPSAATAALETIRPSRSVTSVDLGRTARAKRNRFATSHGRDSIRAHRSRNASRRPDLVDRPHLEYSSYE